MKPNTPLSVRLNCTMPIYLRVGFDVFLCKSHADPTRCHRMRLLREMEVVDRGLLFSSEYVIRVFPFLFRVCLLSDED